MCLHRDTVIVGVIFLHSLPITFYSTCHVCANVCKPFYKHKPKNTRRKTKNALTTLTLPVDSAKNAKTKQFFFIKASKCSFKTSMEYCAFVSMHEPRFRFLSLCSFFFGTLTTVLYTQRDLLMHCRTSLSSTRLSRTPSYLALNRSFWHGHVFLSSCHRYRLSRIKDFSSYLSVCVCVCFP